MKKYFLLINILFVGVFSHAQETKIEIQNTIKLPNGWSLSPAGKSLPLGDLPLNMAVSASKKYMAVTNNGQGKQSIQLINLSKNKILDNIVVDKSWLGIAFSKDEKNERKTRRRIGQI